eukprot:CAMPEP_0174705156 /NCGR_PEP_ID=MMETSP1094-20130205/8480_1 /TAXON_ID=156173 /ORGANISM="Chrysochromulina brevifilum, Strain UTEX LB 985" /LENGTH=61 /DNA_ID=CAMNT_0015903285 /DNA_START=806 /DNA_END=991 /DNA_ORIENTATION=-
MRMPACRVVFHDDPADVYRHEAGEEEECGVVCGVAVLDGLEAADAGDTGDEEGKRQPVGAH